MTCDLFNIVVHWFGFEHEAQAPEGRQGKFYSTFYHSIWCMSCLLLDNHLLTIFNFQEHELEDEDVQIIKKV